MTLEEHFFLEKPLSETRSLVTFHRQIFIFGSFMFLGKLDFSKDVFGRKSLNEKFQKNLILKQILCKASKFESRISKPVRIRATFLQFVSFWIETFTACKILKVPF